METHGGLRLGSRVKDPCDMCVAICEAIGGRVGPPVIYREKAHKAMHMVGEGVNAWSCGHTRCLGSQWFSASALSLTDAENHFHHQFYFEMEVIYYH